MTIGEGIMHAGRRLFLFYLLILTVSSQCFFLFYRHREMFDSSLLNSQFLYSFLHNTLDVFSQ